MVLDSETLLQRVRDERRFAPVCRASKPFDVFVALTQAMFWGRRLTLADPQFTEAERQKLGLDAKEAAAEEILPTRPIRDSAELRERCAAQRGFELELFTSGSTGLPKRVVHTLSGLTRTLRTGPKHVGDAWGFLYNPAHLAGVQVFLQAFFNGNRIVDLYGLAPQAALAAIESEGVTHLSATPTCYRFLLAEKPPPNDRVRHITLGGESADERLMRELRAVFPAARIRNHYASTECGTLFVSEGDVFTVPDSIRRQVDVEGGTLRVHASLVGRFAGDETAVTDPGGSGARVSAASGDWYDTGDRVEVVSQAPLRFRITGRERDWVNVGGEKVDPAEVEAALREHEAVADAQVYGRANSVVGHILCARVVLRGEAKETTLRDFLAGRLQTFKVPRVFSFVSSIQRTRTGKAARP